MSENIPFALYTSSDDSNFWEKWLFGSKMLGLSKNANKQGWKVSKVTFWPKPNMLNSVYTKALNLEL